MADDTSTAAELQRLRDVERKLRAIIEHVPAFILELDRNARVVYINRSPPGHEVDAMQGTDAHRWMEPQYHAAFDRCLAHVFATGEAAEYESVDALLDLVDQLLDA